MFLGGPPLVKLATGEESDDESLGGAEMHARTSGLADYFAADEQDAIRIGRTHYDAMLARVIIWAPTRTQAATALARTLHRSRIHGPRTNRGLLVNVLRHPAFLAGETHTGFLEQHRLASLAAGLDADTERVFALVAALAIDTGRRAEAPVLPEISSNWRNVVSQAQRVELDGPSERHDVRSGWDGVGWSPRGSAGSTASTGSS